MAGGDDYYYTSLSGFYNLSRKASKPQEQASLESSHVTEHQLVPPEANGIFQQAACRLQPDRKTVVSNMRSLCCHVAQQTPSLLRIAESLQAVIDSSQPELASAASGDWKNVFAMASVSGQLSATLGAEVKAAQAQATTEIHFVCCKFPHCPILLERLL